MNSENYIEQAKQFTKDLWHSYLSFPETETELNAFIQCFTPQATVIGTGKHEFYQNRDAFLEGLNKDLGNPGWICLKCTMNGIRRYHWGILFI